jgi:hypothetical protein
MGVVLDAWVVYDLVVGEGKAAMVSFFGVSCTLLSTP